MKNKYSEKYQVLPSSTNPKFEQRELGITHTPYQLEIQFYSLIKLGCVEEIEKFISAFYANGLVVGRLSKDNVRQIRYWSVCVITLATRYAIQGGLDEFSAFNLSDEYILRIDEAKNEDSVFEILQEGLIEFATLVRKKSVKNCPKSINNCLEYIEVHLHENISLARLSKTAGLSQPYLSALFKKYMGVTVSEYILLKKMELAVAMLYENIPSGKIAYQLGFCSQSYFCDCFKKIYGKTPYQYKKSINY